ncbi:MAG: thiamine pyrophosphate-dependent enzyme [Hyphomicrobiales bacterium]
MTHDDRLDAATLEVLRNALDATAEEMGALGIRVERASELPGALAQALAANRPVIIDVVTDIEALAPTAVT